MGSGAFNAVWPLAIGKAAAKVSTTFPKEIQLSKLSHHLSKGNAAQQASAALPPKKLQLRKQPQC